MSAITVQPQLGQRCGAEIDAEHAFLLAAQEKASTLGSQIAFSSMGFSTSFQ
jgi:hypothetical protein